MTQPLGPNQILWIEALRSGKYPQGKSNLCINGKYCCLGVGCEVLGIPKTPNSSLYSNDINEGEIRYESHGATDPESLIQKLKLYSCTGRPKPKTYKYSLVTLNDSMNMTFDDIADELEKNPERWFTEPA